HRRPLSDTIKIPRRGTGGTPFCESAKDSLTILWALLAALLSTFLATTALLTALASGRLSLLTWFLRFLLTTLLAALLAALLLPAHFFVSHGAILLRGRISAGGQSPRHAVGSLSDKCAGKECRNKNARPLVSTNNRHASISTCLAPTKRAHHDQARSKFRYNYVA